MHNLLRDVNVTSIPAISRAFAVVGREIWLRFHCTTLDGDSVELTVLAFDPFTGTTSTLTLGAPMRSTGEQSFYSWRTKLPEFIKLSVVARGGNAIATVSVDG